MIAQVMETAHVGKIGTDRKSSGWQRANADDLSRKGLLRHHQGQGIWRQGWSDGGWSWIKSFRRKVFRCLVILARSSKSSVF